MIQGVTKIDDIFENLRWFVCYLVIIIPFGLF